MVSEAEIDLAVSTRYFIFQVGAAVSVVYSHAIVSYCGRPGRVYRYIPFQAGQAGIRRLGWCRAVGEVQGQTWILMIGWK